MSVCSSSSEQPFCFSLWINNFATLGKIKTFQLNKWLKKWFLLIICRFFGFGVPTKKKSTTTAPNPLSLQGQSTGGLGSLPQASSLGAGSGSSCAPPSASTTSGAAAVVAAATGTTGTAAAVLGRRRGSDRSLSGSVHELGVVGGRVSHSHSQSNLSDIPYRSVNLYTSFNYIKSWDFYLIQERSTSTSDVLDDFV